MCGIGGVFGSAASSAHRFIPYLHHRGPDYNGTYVSDNGQVGLIHTRLAIQDLSPLGRQPMISEDGLVGITFNGEIYNFRELRKELVDKGAFFKGGSDTEVLLSLYLAEGHAMLRRLNGIFAFAIWDARNRTLFLARDALGVKPLYYSSDSQCFLFASEVKALTALLSTSGQLDEEAIERYLTFLWCPGAGTPARNIRKLLPGEAMTVRSGSIERRWFWYQLPVFRQKNKSLPKCSKVIEVTRKHLQDAVHRQLVADVPVGAFLSGGLDSSAIVAFARDRNPDIRCFTIESVGGQETGFTDDLPYARRVAKHLGVSLDVVRIDASRMASDLERMVWHLDEPLADPAPLNVMYISQLARDQGIKVLLSGAGGDDLFTGYRRHRALMAEKWWAWLPVSVRRGLAHFSGSLDQSRVMGRRLAKLFSGAALDGDARLVNYFRWIRRDDLDRLYTDEFRSALNDSKAEAPMLDFLQDLPSKTSRLERMLALEQRFFLTDHNLTYTDKMSMAVGVEVRVPFLDLDLVEFASRIPAKYKQRGKEGKWVLKKAMEPYLPHDVIYRPKSGFGAPLRRWMRHELREMLGDLLSTESLQRRGLFNPSSVQQLIFNNDAGQIDASYTLFSLLCIEIWCRRFIDQSEPPPFFKGVSL
jgi:asparagine synthase (glutamine-hydrolysing)